jgi:outer membrane receptor protein involved in Fe transport
VRDVADLARTVPGLSMRSTGQFDQLNVSIRGIESTVGAATTGVYINDTPIQGRYVCFYCGFNAYPQLFDLERVEVLRGPQGTLFGAGSEGGTLRFITPSPSLTDYTGYARSEFATSDRGAPSWEIGASGGGPIIENELGFRASLWTRTDGGYIDRVSRTTSAVVQKDSNEQQTYVGRLAFTYAPLANLQITPSILYQKSEKDGPSLSWLNSGRDLTSFSWLPAPDNDWQSVSALDITYDAASFTVKSISSFYDRSQNRQDDYSDTYPAFYLGGPNVIPGFEDYRARSLVDTMQRNWTQELRFSSNTEPGQHFTWVGGLFYSHSRIAFTQAVVSDFDAFIQAIFGAPTEVIFGSPPLGPNRDISYLEHTSQLEEEIAGFGELNYQLTDRLRLTAGLRVARSEFSFELNQEGPEAGGTIRTKGEARETPVTPKVSVSYEIGNKLLYATVADGYRIGGANSSVAIHPACEPFLQQLNLTDAPPTYDSDSVRSYEVGAKGRFRDNRAQLAASFFWIDWKDIQSNVLLGCGYNYVGNLGSAVSKGFDVAGQLRLWDGLTLSGSVGYTKSYYTDSVNFGGAFLTREGQRRPGSPWTGSASAQYEFSLEALNQFYLRADYQYASRFDSAQPADVVGADPEASQTDATAYLSLRAGTRIAGADISLFVNNALNDDPIVNRFRDTPNSTQFYAVSVRPRAYGLTVSWRF